MVRKRVEKGKGITLIIAPQTATAAAAALYVTEKAGVQPIAQTLSPRSWDFNIRRTAIRSPGLLFNDLHPVIHYTFTDPGGMEG